MTGAVALAFLPTLQQLQSKSSASCPQSLQSISRICTWLPSAQHGLKSSTWDSERVVVSAGAEHQAGPEVLAHCGAQAGRCHCHLVTPPHQAPSNPILLVIMLNTIRHDSPCTLHPHPWLLYTQHATVKQILWLYKLFACTRFSGTACSGCMYMYFCLCCLPATSHHSAS